MKFLILQFFIIIFMVFTIDVSAQNPLYWSDLDIIQQWRLVLGSLFMVILGIFAAVIFRSVWVKNGYAGTDKILDGDEVSLFMSHVIAFALVEIFFFMILFSNYQDPPSYALWICAGGFLSPTVVKGLHFVMDKFKK